VVKKVPERRPGDGENERQTEVIGGKRRPSGSFEVGFSSILLGWLRKVVLHPAIILAALLLCGLAWVVASPVGSEPDADFHNASLWCQTGGPDSRCERRYLIDGVVAVKTYVALGPPCYAGRSTVSAGCQKITRNTYYTERVNNGDYPQGYYRVMGLFTSSRLIPSTLIIRFANFGIFAGLISLVYWLVSPALRRSMVLTLSLGLVPVGIYFLASINPSSWAITGIAVQFFALLGLGEVVGRTRVLSLSVLAVGGGVLAASARGDAAAYAAGVSIVCAWLVFPSLRRRSWRWLAFVVPIVVGVVTTLSAKQVTGGVDGATETDSAAYNFFQILQVPLGNLGVGGGLGWLDTPMPALTWVLTTLVLGAVLITEIPGIGWRRGLAALGVTAAMIGLPYLMLERTGFRVGQFVQARYVLPLLIVLIGVLAWRASGSPSLKVKAPSLALMLSLAVAQSAALYANLVRYTNGFHPYLLGAKVSWWWPIPFPPQAVWVAGSLAFAWVVLALTIKSGSRAGLTEPEIVQHSVISGSDRLVTG
jgi:hypothetical protein